MLYIFVAAVIIFIASAGGLSFALWQFKHKNIFGGIMVSLVSVLPAVLICMRFRV